LAFRLGLSGFIIPFFFIYHPGLLILGTGAWETIYALVLASAAVLSIAAALEGWVGTHLKMIERILLGLSALFLSSTIIPLNITGLVVCGTLFLVIFLRYKKTKTIKD